MEWFLTSITERPSTCRSYSRQLTITNNDDKSKNEFVFTMWYA